VRSDSVCFPVRPKPAVTFTPCLDPVTTPEARPYVLKGGIPAGSSGIYSGDGVTQVPGQYLFTPSTVTPPLPKTVTLTYSFTNTWGCPGSDSVRVQVVAPPPFQCGNILQPLKDVRTTPYRTYGTYLKGGKCWMTENLDYGTVLHWNAPQTDNCIPEKYSGVGSFYQWNELMQYDATQGVQGLCPPGWHIPELSEWQALFDDPANWGNGLAGGYLRDGTFAAQTYGVLYQNSTWSFAPPAALNALMFWTSTPEGVLHSWARGINNRNTSMSLYPSGKENAFNVRCVKD
jgi:uncharacterized protein (TIGR02145 family)